MLTDCMSVNQNNVSGFRVLVSGIDMRKHGHFRIDIKKGERERERERENSNAIIM